MKKLLTYIILASALITKSNSAETNSPEPLIKVTTTITTNVVTIVKPINITDEQMDGIISSVQAGGITSSVQITTNNLKSINVRKNGTNGFSVFIQLQ